MSRNVFSCLSAGGPETLFILSFVEQRDQGVGDIVKTVTALQKGVSENTKLERKDEEEKLLFHFEQIEMEGWLNDRGWGGEHVMEQCSAVHVRMPGIEIMSKEQGETLVSMTRPV